jgi:ribonuclease PH
VQGTAERAPFSEARFLDMLGLARRGAAQLIAMQKAAVGA